jgi:hypothetical protein
MAGMTREERKKHISERRHSKREKTVVLGTLFVTVAIFVSAIYLSLAYRVEPWIPILLIIGLFLLIVLSTFFVDFIFFEGN